MNKISALLIALFFITVSASAQRKYVYLIKKNGDYILEQDSADHVRILEELNKNSKKYLVRELFMTGETKAEGISTDFYSLNVYEGSYTSFYKNGKVKKTATYKNGRLIDTVQNYYPNGALYTKIVYKGLVDTFSVH